MADIAINHLKRIEGSSVKEITIGRKSLKTHQTIPKFQIKSDIQLFLDNINNIPKFQGVALDLWSIPAIYQSISLPDSQRSLDSNVKAVTPAKQMLDKRIGFIDPNTEWYRYKYQTRVEKSKDKKIVHTRQTEIMNQRKFPNAIKDIFIKNGTAGHNVAWVKVEKNNLLLSFVLWHIEQSLKYNANLIIPPAPLTDGKSIKLLSIANKINNIAKELTFDMTDAYCSFYLPLHPDVFKQDVRCKRVIQIIKKNMTVNNLLVLKFFRIKEILGNSLFRARLSRFLTTIDYIKKSLFDNIAVIVLDTKAEGIALMANGVDITCDPMGGLKDAIFFKKSSSGSGGNSYEEMEKNPLRNHGKYLHPDARDYMPISDLMGALDNNGLLPHDCFACKKLHGRLSTISDPNFPKSIEWNTLRRLHNFTFRREEDKWLSNAVIDENIRAAETYLSQRKRADKNLVDLLPSIPF